MSLVSSEARKMYGEYYTPDWLAEFVVEEKLDEKWLDHALSEARASDESFCPGVGVLDPCCGSGTILLYAIRHIAKYLRELAPELSPLDIGVITERLVVGIDIHPIAVEMAKATAQRALPGKSNNARIYQGDALLLADKERSLVQHGLLKKLREGAMLLEDLGINRPLQLSEELLLHPDIEKSIREVIDNAKNGADISNVALKKFSPKLKNELRMFHDAMTAVIEKRGDSLWSWYFCNLLAPRRIEQTKVNRIISNPPWLRYSELRDTRRNKLVLDATNDAKLVPGGKNNTGMDLAALVVHDTKKLYLTEDGDSAYILPQGAVTAMQWEPARRMGVIDRILDLRSKHADGRGLNPIPFKGSSECCVAGIANKKIEGERLVNRIEVEKHQGLRWVEIRDQVERRRPLIVPTGSPSPYLDKCRQGSTIVPGVLVIVDPSSRDRTLKGNKDKGPWKKLNVSILKDIPDEWIVEYLRTKNLKTLHVLNTSLAIIPNKNLQLLTSDQAIETSNTWKSLERLYAENKGTGRTTPTNLCEQLNYNNKLAVQFPSRLHVVYNTSGQILRAAWSKLPIESGLYRIPVSTYNEAAYLAGVLSAPALSKCFMAYRRSDRHFHKTPLENVPVPRFDRKHEDHTQIARAAKFVSKHPGDANAFERINEAVQRILPEYAWIERKW